MEKVLDSQFTACYSYNSNGTIKSLRVGDKLTTHYEYDSDKNLTRQWTKMQGSVTDEKCDRFKLPKADTEGMTLLADYHYSYDGNGNRIRKDSLTGSTTYAYDSLNRLAKVQYPKGLEEFTYDKADNRIRRLTEKEEELYKYDVCNRLVEKKTLSRKENLLEEIQKKGEGKKTVFQYDNQGNLLREERKTEGSRQESIYSYDGFNRQKKVVNFENKVQVNHYDGEGLRHEMEENGKLVKFLYADREAVAEEKEDGNVIRFIRGYDLIASDSESARTYYHYASDEQGSITHVLGEDENGEYDLRNYYEYGAFGDFREKYEEVENRFGYNGEIFDPIGGQYYLRARYYNPVIGRFTQEDTYYGEGLNLYAYCRNLPVGYEDPSGHYPCETKLELYKKYRKQGLSKKEADIQSNYDLIRKKQGKRAAKKYLKNERKKQKLIASGMTPKQANDFIKKKPKQIHHFATNKSKKYKKQFEHILEKYKLNLDDEWNKKLLPHQGRHPYEYHEYVLDSMRKIDAIAQGDIDTFLKLYEKMKLKIIKHPEMLYKDYWKNG